MKIISKPKIGVLVTCILILVTLCYFFVIRPSDNDYNAASTELNNLKSTASTLQSTLASIQNPGSIDGTQTPKLQKAVDSYKQSLQNLEKNRVVIADATVKNTYSQVKNVLSSYNQSSSDLTKSISMYVLVLYNCTKYTQLVGNKDITAQDNQLKLCIDATNKGTSSPYKEFNSQFFTEYNNQTYLYVSAIVSATNAKDQAAINKDKVEISQIHDKISALGSIKIDYSLPDPSDSLNKLSSIIDSQKSALFR